jgi:hypothetical protein
MGKNKFKVCREGVEVGTFDASEMLCALRRGKVRETDECFVDFEGFWEKCRIFGTLKLANDMECLYRLIKSHAGVSINDLVRLSRMSEAKVRYYVRFFLWYGVATDADDAETLPESTSSSRSGGLSEDLVESENINLEAEVVLLTERNINFVEGFKCRRDGEKLSALEFFVDAYMELPASDGFDD